MYYNHCYFQWLNDVFLTYFIDWRDQVRSTPNMTTAEQNKMFISQQTFHGIVMTGKYGTTMPVCFNSAP